jgi:hypothetical protein
MILAELEVQARIADPDNVWWLRLAYYVRDIEKSKTQLIKLDVPKPFLGRTLTRRTMNKFYLLCNNPSSQPLHHFMCEMKYPTLFLLYSF